MNPPRAAPASAAAPPPPGIDHERLRVLHNGADRRLADVHGHVVKAALA